MDFIKKTIRSLILFILALSLTACGKDAVPSDISSAPVYTEEISIEDIQGSSASGGFDLAQLPDYAGEGTFEVNGNEPFFEETDLLEEGQSVYSPLDALGRCGPAMICAGPETLPEGERRSIADIKPTGWHTVKYDGIAKNDSDPGFLYNRCHLLAHCIAGRSPQNDQAENLITGTRYMNTDGGMLPYEIRTAEYIQTTGDHVLYRVTPVFLGDDLLAKGVLMEAQSLEEDGLSFCVFAYNVQPGITIDYATGESSGPAYTGSGTGHSEAEEKDFTPAEGTTYVLNTNTKRFHLPSCEACTEMSPWNREETELDRLRTLQAMTKRSVQTGDHGMGAP